MHLVFDSNLPPKLAKGISILEEGNKRSLNPAKVSHVHDFLDPHTLDPQIIEEAGKHHWIIITQDLGFGRIEHEFTILKEHKVSVIFLRVPPNRGMSYWEMVQTFISKWENLKATIKEKGMPCALVIEKTGGIKHLEHIH